eukprot:1940003-Karenia_brevis.AAC.1
MAVSNDGMQDNGLPPDDPLVNADPWAQTPRSGARTASGVSLEWFGWPTDKELLQKQLQAIRPARVA